MLQLKDVGHGVAEKLRDRQAAIDAAEALPAAPEPRGPSQRKGRASPKVIENQRGDTKQSDAEADDKEQQPQKPKADKPTSKQKRRNVKEGSGSV